MRVLDPCTTATMSFNGTEHGIRLVLDGLIILPASWPGIGWPGLTTATATPQQATANTGKGTRPQ